MNKLVLKLTGVLAVLVPVLGIFLSMSFKTDFSIGKNVLSDLGADSRTEHLFNYSLILGGILSIIYFLNENSLLGDSKISRRFFLVASLGLAVLGLFPVYDATYWYFQRVMHWIGGLLFFVGFPLGMFTLGISLKSTRFRKFSFYYAILTLLVPAVLIFNNNMSVLQFSIVALIINWFFLFVVRVFRHKSIV